MKWWDPLQPHTPSCNTQGCTAALPWRWMEDTQGMCVLARCRAGLPSSPIASQQGGAQLCVEPEIWTSLEASSTHGSKHSTFSLLFGETKLGDDKCARWTSFACRNLRSSSLCWSYKQLKAIYGQSKVKQFTHVLSDLFISSCYVHPPQVFHFLPLFSSINHFSSFLSIPTEPDI